MADLLLDVPELLKVLSSLQPATGEGGLRIQDYEIPHHFDHPISRLYAVSRPVLPTPPDAAAGQRAARHGPTLHHQILLRRNHRRARPLPRSRSQAIPNAAFQANRNPALPKTWHHTNSNPPRRPPSPSNPETRRR